MSRKYCSVCGEPHKNTWRGLCDTHIEEEEIQQIADRNETADAYNQFMEKSEEDRWEVVFDYLRYNNVL
jgi:hypothetical protein